MNQVLRITIGLTISCLLAALVMGAVFTVTHEAKKHNEHLNVQATMFGLLGYTETHPPPTDLKLYNIYRYIIEEDEKSYLGYLVPVRKGNEVTHRLLMIDLEGKFVDQLQVDLSPEEATEAPEREKALRKVLSPPRRFSYGDSTIIAERGGQRLAYLLPGEFPGFKTFIRVMLAIDPRFEILGLEIMEQEEDPGLGGDIGRAYFRNQFQDKTFEKLKDLQVVKEPLPEEYRRYLERKERKGDSLSREEIDKIRSKYQDHDIYALTGATISSAAVTNGVKAMVKKFAYRVKILDRVIASQDVPVAF